MRKAFRSFKRVAGLCFSLLAVSAHSDPQARALLIQAIQTDDPKQQIALVQSLRDPADTILSQALSSWRQGGLFLFETNGVTTPFILDAQSDANGKARAVRVADGQFITDGAGVPVMFAPSELAPVDTSSGLRRAIKTVLDLFAMENPEPRTRREAVVKLGQEQNPTYLPYFLEREKAEVSKEVRQALVEAIAMTQLVSTNSTLRLEAIRRLGDQRSINALASLKTLQQGVAANPTVFGIETVHVLAISIREIEDHIALGNFFGTAFRGFSLAAVLLVAALGLAITFGLMGVINMAHGEIMAVGSYTAFVTQNVFKNWFGATGLGFDAYFLAALVMSFVVAGLTGLILERGVIRFLYKRPLESLLATWGVSLVLQQVFRTIFGAANVQVNSPSWMSGSFVVSDVLLAYNRIFVIAFAIFIVLLTWALLTKTSLGLQIRAVMQNRSMASALGVRTDRVNMMTFAFGSGLAGMAGACLSQLANVGPSLGQNYIVDCFMVVVLGGVGNLIGTVAASFGIGVTDEILQPWVGAVLGKITVLAAIILFLQWRPAGIFVTRSRSLEG